MYGEPTPEEMKGFFHAFDVMEETLSKETRCQTALQIIRNKRALLTSQKERHDAQNQDAQPDDVYGGLGRIACSCSICKNTPLPSFIGETDEGEWFTVLARRRFLPAEGGSTWLKSALIHAAILLSGLALLALYAGFPRASAPVFADPQPTTTVPSPISPGIED